MTTTGTSRESRASNGRRARQQEMEGRCLRCGFAVPRRPSGCKGGHCGNCGHPYPLGDCSD